MGKQIRVCLKVRRFDLIDDPDFDEVSIDFDSTIDYQTLKKSLYTYFNLSTSNNVIKLRNMDNFLIPLGELLNESNNCFILDVSKIKYTDTHMKIINKKIGSLLERLNEVEELSRDLEWQKQSNLEENINGLTDRVEFLNRRFDLLLPTTLKQHFQ